MQPWISRQPSDVTKGEVAVYGRLKEHGVGMETVLFIGGARCVAIAKSEAIVIFCLAQEN